MSRSEFDQWLKNHIKLFPQVMEWLEQQDMQFLMGAWSKAMSRTTLKSAMKCSERMVSGDVQHPNRFEIGKLPGVVIQNCPRLPIPFSELQGKNYNPATGDVT